MALEQFFEQGNKLLVYGSSVYMPSKARDIDFAIFTQAGKKLDSVEDEITRFLKARFGDKYADLLAEYELSSLPNNSFFEGAYLTGQFFPDEEFIKAHYETLFGPDYLNELWPRFANRVMNILPNCKSREDNYSKNLPMLLKATERMIPYSNRISDLMRRYKQEYILAKPKFKERTLYYNQEEIKYKARLEFLLEAFISEATEILNLPNVKKIGLREPVYF